MEAATEEELLVIWKTKSENDFFKVLLATYQKRIFYFLLRKLNDQESAKDATQTVFIKVFQHLQKFKGESSFYTWIYAIARNVSYDFLKKQQKSYAIFNSIPTEDQYSWRADESTLNSVEIENILQKAIETLPEKQKKVFELRYFDEMSYKEMAELLGGSVGGLKASYHHAAQKVETFLKNQDL